MVAGLQASRSCNTTNTSVCRLQARGMCALTWLSPYLSLWVVRELLKGMSVEHLSVGYMGQTIMKYFTEQVKFPLHTTDPCMDLLGKMLCYCPAVRCSALDGGRHELLQHPVPSQEFDIVTKLSYETLAAVVRDAAQTGEPVTQQSLRIAMSMQRSQPPSSDV